MPKNAGTEPLYDHLHIMWHCALIRLLQFNSFAATPSFMRRSLLSLLGQHCCYAQRTSSCVSLDSATLRMQRRNTKQFEPAQSTPYWKDSTQNAFFNSGLINQQKCHIYWNRGEPFVLILGCKTNRPCVEKNNTICVVFNLYLCAYVHAFLYVTMIV